MALRQEEFASLCDDVDLDRDRALVERCQAGDSAAFGNLYARYYERLLRFCLRRLNDRHEAEDAAQEAFARAWKALPNFAGERRFYPWLTVIAGNICTDMLRRRSRSTPTDDVELGSHQPMGVSTADTSEELVLAAVDGELVTRALGRLSSRHQHVLAMREGSGWTYQQIADHEGVEIGTIETLLWRARQALKREFTVLSESKGALAGFLAGAGALLKRTVFRVAHRTSVMQANGSGAGSGLRNAVIGGAVTSAAVAAALITPHALSSGPSHNAPQVALPNGTLTMPAPLAIAPSAPAATSGLAESATSFAGAAIDGSPAVAPGGTSGGLLGGTAMHNGGLSGAVSGSGSGGGLSATTQNPGSTAGGVVGGVGGGLQGLTGGLLGSGSPLGSVTAPIAGVTTPVLNDVGTLTNTIATTLDNLAPTLGLGQVLSGLNGVISGTTSGSSGSTSPTTTTPTTNPVSGLVNGVAGTVNKTLGGVTKLLGGK